MGHLGHLKEEYRDLVRRLDMGTVGLPEPDAPKARAARQEILEILYTPAEAALGALMPVKPASLETISQRVGIAPPELERALDGMANKGLVMDIVNPRTGDTIYMLSPPVVGFFEFSLMRIEDTIPKKRMAELLEAYTHGDPAFSREVFAGETVVGRALIHENALSDDPMPDVLEWERATAVIEDARSHAVANCYCRHKAEHLDQRCDVPMENCLSLNAGADFIIRREFGRKIDRSEALDILQASRESGLVQIADNVQNRPTYICNCCGCCCGQLQSINDFDLPAVNPSPFLASPIMDKCKGCSKCSRACPIGAITMAPRRVTAKRKNQLEPVVNEERCIGCGVCAGPCRTHAMDMVPRARRPHIPKNAVERSIRMAIERGRLPHLVADEGANRGSRFLNRVLQTLCSLPSAEKLLASEQLQSRFVDYALGTIRDPTGD